MKHHLKRVQAEQYGEYSKTFKDDRKTTDLFLAISQLIQSRLEQFEDEC
jgi:hypothetical protein